jgi:apoptosis-inducing factor 2
LHDTAKHIDFEKQTLTTSHGTLLSYDKLVIATGVRHGIFTKNESKETMRSNIAAAQNILIVGGGPIGVELAGEIIEYFPSKKVTVQHTKSELLGTDYPHKLRTSISILAKKYICVIGPDADTNGYDLVIQSYGMTPNTQFLDKHYCNDKGFIQVNSKLAIVNTHNAYALGDVNTCDPVKTWIHGKDQSAVLVQNLLGKEMKYQPKKHIIIGLPFGTSKGRASVPFGLVLGDIPTSLVKSKSLMLGMVQKLFE